MYLVRNFINIYDTNDKFKNIFMPNMLQLLHLYGTIDGIGVKREEGTYEQTGNDR